MFSTYGVIYIYQKRVYLFLQIFNTMTLFSIRVATGCLVAGGILKMYKIKWWAISVICLSTATYFCLRQTVNTCLLNAKNLQLWFCSESMSSF